MIPPLDVVHTTVYLLLHARNADVQLDRSFDLTVLVPEGCQLDEKVDFIHVFRRLKIICSLGPWPAAEEENGIADLKGARESMQFAIRFVTRRGAEAAFIARLKGENDQNKNV